MWRPLVSRPALSLRSRRSWATAAVASTPLAVRPPLHTLPAQPAELKPAGPWSRRRLETVVADGWTPLEGRVLEARASGVLVDVGCRRPGLLPARGHFAQDAAALAALQPGRDVTVYANLNQRGTGDRKLTLSLTRRERPRLRWAGVVADGLTPYSGVVSNITDYGAFVDFGCEVQGLLGPRLPPTALDRLRIGDELAVYVCSKHPQTRKIDLSLERRTSPLMRAADVCADGRTHYEGTVLQVKDDIGTFFDIGAEIAGLLPAKDRTPDEHGLRPGDKAKVYVVKRNSWKGQITLALQPLKAPQRPLRDVVADGQTPYRGVVTSIASFGSFVDFGFEALALLPARDALEAPGGPPQVGSEVVVYAVAVERDKDKVTVSLQRSRRPLERFQALVADGCTPYSGRVVQIDCGGFFVDIGSERAGFLPGLAAGERATGIRMGDELTVYISEKSPHSMRLWLSMEPRARPLAPLRSLAVDGQTPHEGAVKWVGDVGASVDLGFERSVLLPRDDRTGLIPGDDGTVAVGASVVVYALRSSSATGKTVVSLLRSPVPRVRMAEVAVDDPHTWYSGQVYAINFHEVLLDFGCELSGVLPFSEAPHCARGDTLRVRAVAYDASTDRFVLSASASPDASPSGLGPARSESAPAPLPAPSEGLALQAELASEATDALTQAEAAAEAADALAQAEPAAAAAARAPARAPPSEGAVPASASSSSARAVAGAPAEQTPPGIARELEQRPDPPALAPAGRVNFKGRLQEAAMAEARTPLRKGDISYASDRTDAGLFVARVSLREGLPGLGGLCSAGEPRRSKAEAEQSAAEAVLAQVASVGAAEGAGGETE